MRDLAGRAHAPGTARTFGSVTRPRVTLSRLLTPPRRLGAAALDHFAIFGAAYAPLCSDLQRPERQDAQGREGKSTPRAPHCEWRGRDGPPLRGPLFYEPHPLLDSSSLNLASRCTPFCPSSRNHDPAAPPAPKEKILGPVWEERTAASAGGRGRPPGPAEGEWRRGTPTLGMDAAWPGAVVRGLGGRRARDRGGPGALKWAP